MMVGPDSIKGKKTTEARDAVVAWLKERGLLEKEEDINQNISTAERTGGIVEPLPKLQWWIAVNKPFTLAHSQIKSIASGSQTTLKELMITSVRNGQIGVIPERFEKEYFHWIENLRDWCISRQIWYGHQVPVWYREQNGKKEIFCDVTAPKSDGKGDWTQDPDTLDTWFSSGLWTFSTLGWPDLNAADLKTYHPTSVLETGRDIIFFWVARMILMTTYFLGDIPFKTVYLHGLVTDAKGKKMSKSEGNIIDPLEMITKYGTDALRLSLIVGNGPGNDTKLSEDKIRAYKNFANKIWNATRFVLTSIEGADLSKKPSLTDTDKAHIEAFHTTLSEVTADIEHYRLYLAAEKLYHYFWHTFADVIIEESKAATSGDDVTKKLSAQWTLHHILTESLKALHPFIPFVTEEIWQTMGHNDFLMVSPWPKTTPKV